MINNDINIKEDVIQQLAEITQCKFIGVTTRGNTAIEGGLGMVSKGKNVLIPNEGGWLTYKTIPLQFGLEVVEVKCKEAVLDLVDLEEKLRLGYCGALLYQNPAGYYAEQPMKKIFILCQKYNCLVILDVSGSIGTEMCDKRYADILVGSFGTWKLVEAKGGGFIASDSPELWNKMRLELLDNEDQMKVISEQLKILDKRIKWLSTQREKIVKDLQRMDIAHVRDKGFVVVVRFSSNVEKDRIIDYCKEKGWEWTECPRYIRLNDKAISIEIKRKIRKEYVKGNE
ncbi:aminotransferase class V-fold PLP-dependent enzyme [Candidatus Woesearchaeota archaeon]|nr:aminotransferase class V-fold PLP-dependent enzyme [Candidatus Woesearchaeota archaeon]